MALQYQTIPIVIPAYEPDKHLLNLVVKLRDLGFPLIIVDDGSGVKYAAIFEAIQSDNVTVLTHESNQGKGQALKTAFAYILAHMPECIGVVTADADGQHLPNDIVHVADQLLLQPSHLILGVRKFVGVIPMRSKFGNNLTKSIFATLIGKKISDTQTGLRGIPLSLLQSLLAIHSNGYEYELEMLIYAVQHHIPITEQPITTVYENNNACSHFNPLFDSAKIYFVFLRFCSLGLATALLDLLVFAACFAFTNTIFFSECFARGSGGLFSFMTSRHVVFKSNGSYKMEFLKFLTLWLGLLFISYAMISGAHALGFNVYISKIFSQAILFIASFSIQRLLIFPYNPQKA
jgi:glycosyltransferase involved in cell wall biosynthesis